MSTLRNRNREDSPVTGRTGLISPERPKVMIVAGEASGDLHGSNLVRTVRTMAPHLSFYGAGGPKMKSAGVETIVDSAELSVVGIWEVLPSLGKILSALTLLKKRLEEDRPSLLILIDFPDFNLMVAKHAKRFGVPVLYYISPQVWAWRKGRVKKIARLVDRMAVVFPFEVPIYQREGVKVTFVGHPLLDAVKFAGDTPEIMERLGVDRKKRVIGLLPGSRGREVRSLLPPMLEAAEIMASRSPEFEFILPLAPTMAGEQVEELLSRYNVEVRIVEGMTYDVMKVSDMIFAASGTATLEAAIVGTPMVVVYRVSPLSYMLGRMLIDMAHISLPNIVAGRRIVPELIQDEANPGRMVEEAFAILFGKGRAEEMRKDLMDVRDRLGGPGASVRTAEMVIDMVGGNG